MEVDALRFLRHKAVRGLGVALAVLLLGILAAKVFLPAEKIRDLALDQARSALGREVSVGGVSVSLRGGLGVRLSDFAIANPAGFGGDPLLTTKSLDLKLAIKPLLKGEFRVARLVVEQPAVTLQRRADGTNNFTFTEPVTKETTASSDGAASPPPLSVARLAVVDGRLVFQDEGAKAPALQTLHLSGLDVGLSLSDPDPGRYDVTGHLSVASVRMTGPAAVPELRGDVDYALSWDAVTSTLAVQRADMRLLDIPLSCEGSLVLGGDLPTGIVNVAAADLPLVALVPLLPPEMAAKLQGAPDHGRVGAELALTLTGQQEGPLTFSGSAALHDVDLSWAQPFLPAEQPGQVAGQAEGELTFSGSDDPGDISYQGKVQLSGLSFIHSGLVDDLQDLQATVSLTPEQVVVQSCRARFGAGTLELTGSLRDPLPYFLPPEMQTDKAPKTPHLDFVLHAATLDVDRWLPAASPASGAAQEGRRASGPAIPADLEFPALTSTGTFSADSLLYMQVPLTDVRGTVNLRDRLLTVRDVTGAVYQGTVAGRLDIDLNDLQDPRYEGTYEAHGIEVNDFVTRFAGLPGMVYGGCNLQGQFVTNGLDPVMIRDGLTLKADADLAQGRVVTSGTTYQALQKLAAQTGQTLEPNQTLRDLATHISVEQGRVHLNALNTRLGRIGDLKADGSYGFNGDLDYTGSLLLSPSQTEDLFRGGLLGELGKLLGSQRPTRLEIPLSVGGTRRAPEFQLKLGAVLHDLEQKAAQEQGDKLQDEAKRKLGDLLKKWK